MFFVTGLACGSPSHSEHEQSFGYDPGELGKKNRLYEIRTIFSYIIFPYTRENGRHGIKILFNESVVYACVYKYIRINIHRDQYRREESCYRLHGHFEHESNEINTVNEQHAKIVGLTKY